MYTEKYSSAVVHGRTQYGCVRVQPLFISLLWGVISLCWLCPCYNCPLRHHLPPHTCARAHPPPPHTRARARAHTHTHTHTHNHTHTHTHTHTHHTLSLPLPFSLT